MTHKNNSLWRFLFSLIPGAGEMYMGFFKAGTSLMSLFFFFIFAAASIGFGELLIIDVIVWFYSFFHVHNLAAMPDEEFYVVEDNYLFSLENVLEKGRDFSNGGRKVFAGILIVVGSFMTWRGALYLAGAVLPWSVYSYLLQLTNFIPRILVGILIIMLGVAMIRGKKKELAGLEPMQEEEGNGTKD